MHLPPKLLIYAMCFLPHSSLYVIRQTCQVLRNLADDFQFDDLNWEILHHEEPCCYITMPLCEELWTIKRIFLRGSLCKPCVTLFHSGELEGRLVKLWQPVDCKGCRVTPRTSLPPGQQRTGYIWDCWANSLFANTSKPQARSRCMTQSIPAFVAWTTGTFLTTTWALKNDWPSSNIVHRSSIVRTWTDL